MAAPTPLQQRAAVEVLAGEEVHFDLISLC